MPPAATRKRLAAARQDLTVMKENHENQERQIKDAPFCWLHKEPLEMIAETFSESDQAASARSVYLALTELASDNGSERFTATKALIAHRACLSISTTERLLKGFEQLNLVAITRNRIGAWKQPNTYTLLTIRNGYATLRNGQPRSNPDRTRKKGKELKEPPIAPQGGRVCRRFRNGAKPLPIAKRNRIINNLNERKARIMRTFPDGDYEPWAVEELASIQQKLAKL